MKGVGEPCAGEPHARFDGRGLETERYGVTAPAPDPTNLLQDAVDANTPNAGDRVIVVGYSQSGRIATIVKRDFIDNHDPADPDATPIAGFVLLSNPNKANGGILQRYKLFGTIPFLEITFDGDTPTNGP